MKGKQVTIGGDPGRRGVVSSFAHEARPFGIREWEVVKVGAHIGLECLRCHRRVVLARDGFKRRVKESASRSE